MTTHCLVLGGGPSGLAAAIYARMAGMTVTLIDHKSGVIDKACGEGLMPAGVDCLQEMGVKIEHMQRFKGIRYCNGTQSACGHFKETGWGIRRLELHQALLNRAEELGVEFAQHKMKHIHQDKQAIYLDDYRGDYLLIADGLHSRSREQLGLQTQGASANKKRFGLRQHFNIPSWTEGYVEVHLSPIAEAYITPVNQHETGVAILFDQRLRDKYKNKGDGDKLYELALNEFPSLKSRLKNITTTSSIRGSGPFKTVVSQHIAGRALLIGDAAGYEDPMTGEGLRLGFATAKAAVQAIQSKQPERYEKQWQKITRRYRLNTAMLVRLRRTPILKNMMIPALKIIPGLFDFILAEMEK